MSLPIAVQVYSVRDDANADLYSTLKQIKEMGYDGVEFAGLYGQSPEQVKAWCQELGLIPISAHVSINKMLENPKLFKTPIVRNGKQATVGYCPEVWEKWE